MQRYTVYFIWKLLYMFRVVPPPIIRSANNYLQHLVFVRPLMLPVAIAAGSTNGLTNTDVVVCALDDGWRYHPKHVEQFPDKINCITLHFCWIYIGIYLRCRPHGPINVKNMFKVRANQNKINITYRRTRHDCARMSKSNKM
jgi:hypothetical protein